MNDKTLHDLDDLLDGDIPQADASSKSHAIKMAGAEFSSHFEKQGAKENLENLQGNSESARHIDNHNTSGTSSASWLSLLTKSIRSFFMNTNNNPMAYKGFVAASVAFIAVSVIFISPQLRDVKDTASLPVTVTTPTQDDSKTKIQPIEEVIVTTTKEPAYDLAEHDNIAKQEGTIEQQLSDASNSSVEREASVALETKPQPVPSAAVNKKQELRARAQVQELNESGLDGFSSLSSSHAISAKLRTKQFELDSQAGPATARPDSAEEYADYQSNPIKLTSEEPVSTFSIDVDTASYTLVRNQLNSGLLPKPQAVRTEEFINYFDYDYPLPKTKSEPFKPTISVLDSPWNKERKLVHIGIKGYDIESAEQPDSNLVFLLDVSGSMSSPNKLPLVKQSVSLLLDTLKPSDTVSIVVYAGAAGTVLEPTKVSDKQKIFDSLSRLDAGGSTAGGAGIQLAYQLAEQNFKKDAVNRIILATDGDFNVGQSSNEDLKTLIERKRESGVFLSILGFGRNNYQDDMMQTLAQNGNGLAAYIDSLSEAKKVLVDEATSTLFPIAKDVKIQVEFNPATVSEYRLVGYETRALKREDFNNDKVDAGDIGAGHSVTAIYEITPTSAKNKSIDAPRYSANRTEASQSDSNEYGFVKMRYKLPDSDTSKLIQAPISTKQSSVNSDVNFSIAVAGFAQLLSNSQHTGELNYESIIKQATKHKGSDPFGYRSEFIQLVRMAEIAKP